MSSAQPSVGVEGVSSRQRRLAVIAALSFSSGLPYMVLTRFLSGWLSSMAVPLAWLGALGFVQLVFSARIFWAFCFDRFPPPWLDQRRGWILLLQLCLAVTLLGFVAPRADGLAGLPWILLIALLVAVLSASQDIVIDAYRIVILPAADLGAGSMVSSIGYKLALLGMGSLSLLLVPRLGWTGVLCLLAALMAALSLVTLAAPGNPRAEDGERRASLRIAIREMGRRFGWRRLLLLLSLVLCYRWTDSFTGVLQLPFLFSQGYSPEQVGAALAMLGTGLSFLGALAGAWLYGRVGLRRCLWIGAVLAVAGNLGYWTLTRQDGFLDGAQSALLLAVGLDAFSNELAQVGYFAFLMSLCEPSLAASQFALLAGLMTLGRFLAELPAPLFAHWLGWESYFLTSVVAVLPALLLLAKLMPWRR
ncbi:MAG: MFS transporter [Synechococcaceae cyanobacterium]|nr:MFS transporter [Synechococcaceae cyanobacterium]